MKILCIGQSAYDITLPVSDYPIENRKYKINNVVECGGGSANNMAYLLALWKMDITFASSIGNDLYGKKIYDELERVGVKTKYLEMKSNVPTTTSYIINNLSNGSRTIITNKKEDMELDINKEINLKPDIILLDGNEYAFARKVIEENKDAIKIIDAGSLKEDTVNLSKLCDYIVCSNDFAKDYTKINFSYQDIDKIKEVYGILDRDFPGKVIITLESYGSITKIDNEFKLVPSIKVESIDSTGAGDIFHGAFTYFIANNYSLLDTLHYSNIAGALSVTKIGSKDSMPKLEEVINYHE